MRTVSGIATLLAALLASACGEQESARAAGAPAPVEISREDIGYYCNMIVADHLGPKAQIHISGQPDPLWFSSVRDAIVFTHLPEEPRNIAAIYVNDMGRASWDAPQAGTWIDARDAWYVIGSNRVGGMGAPEAVPFADKGAAEGFAGAHGGQVAALQAVPRDYVLNDASGSMHAGMQQRAQFPHHDSLNEQHSAAGHYAHHGAGEMPAGAGGTTLMHHGHADQQASQ